MKETIVICYVLLFYIGTLAASTDKDNQFMPEIKFVLRHNDNDTGHYDLLKEMSKKIGFHEFQWILLHGHNDVIETIDQAMIYHSNRLHVISDMYFLLSETIVINLKAEGYCDAVTEIGNTNVLCISDIDECPSNKSVTLFSENILHYKRLYNAIVNNDYDVTDHVIVCLPYNLPNTKAVEAELKKTTSISLTFPDNCDNVNVNSSVIAIVTPKPFKFATTLPTIIYNTPNLRDEEIKDLPNHVNLMRNVQVKRLKYAILEFLKNLRWKRVAVISDDSEDAEEFLDDLIPFFNKNGIVYTAQECNKKDCNFMDAAITLKNANARIVILNMNIKNVEKIMFFINHDVARYVKWIVRDWPFRKDERKMHDFYSFTLSPVYNDTFINVPYLSAIKEGLNIINMEYMRAYGDRELFSVYFRNVTKPPRFHTYAHIVRKKDGQDFRVVGTMAMYDHLAKEIKRDKLYEEVPPDYSSHCIIRGNKFFKPCNDQDLLILLCIFAMFVLTFLVVIVYFSKFRNNAYRRLF